jgi:hypothetical protein
VVPVSFHFDLFGWGPAVFRSGWPRAVAQLSWSGCYGSRCPTQPPHFPFFEWQYAEGA